MLERAARSAAAIVIAYAIASAVFGVEAIIAATSAAAGERGFTFIMLFAAWIGFTPAMFAFAFVAAALILRLVRARGWPRPTSDVVAGALMAMAAPYLASLALDIWAASWGQQINFDSALAEAAAVGRIGAIFAFFPGVLAGYAYWHSAGRPEPPYVVDSDTTGPRAALDDPA